MTNVVIGSLLFIAGAVAGLIFAYWDKIMIFLNLKKSGTLDSGSKVAEGIGELYSQFRSGKLF